MRLSFNEACSHLGLQRKDLDNYAKIGGELKYLFIRRRYYIEKEELDRWNAERQSRLVTLSETEYMRCLEFALRSFYAGHTRGDFSTARQRDAGKFVDDFVRGKLGELAFCKFIQDRFGVGLEADFEIHEEFIVGQDITAVQRGRVVNPPRIRVSVKSTKMRNVYIIVGRNEYELDDRSSDAYVFVRVGLYPNHIFRVLKDTSPLTSLEEMIPDAEPIDAEIVGFAWKNDFGAPVSEVPQQSFEGLRYVLKSGDMRKSEDEWREFTNRL